MALVGTRLNLLKKLSEMSKYRRIIKTEKGRLQPYEIGLITCLILFALAIVTLFVSVTLKSLGFNSSNGYALVLFCLSVVSFGLSIFLMSKRDRVSTLEVEAMGKKAEKLSKRLLSLFSDKWVTDILKLSNTTRYGEEMPVLRCWVADDLASGYIAIENIANYERMDKQKYEQKVSGVFAGKYKKFAVVSSSLTSGDTYVLFHFEDMQTSNRFHVSSDSLECFVSDNPHEIKLSKDLIWRADEVPHLSLIARTRSGKSVLAGRYMAKIMQMQGWIVEYNSAKKDIYVVEYGGESEPCKIVERAEYWCGVMLDRLDKINSAGKEKYLEMSDDMPDIGLFFDELGNLNAELEQDKALKKRWETAINKLSATGASAGLHIIAISQFATKEGFLPSVARVNCSDAVIMLGMAADSADERRYLMSGFADMPKRSYGKGQGIARFSGSGRKWEEPHFFEAPWFD